MQPSLVTIVDAHQPAEGEDDLAGVGAQGGDLLVGRTQRAVREGDLLEIDGGETAVGVQRVPEGPVVSVLFPVAQDARQVAPGGVLDDPENAPNVAGKNDSRDEAADSDRAPDVRRPARVAALALRRRVCPPLGLDREELRAVVGRDRVGAAGRG